VQARGEVHVDGSPRPERRRRRGSRLIARVTTLTIAHPFITVTIAALVAAVSIWLASGLEIRSSFQELLPSDLPSVRLIQEMVKRVGGDGTVFVNVEALNGPQDLPKAETLAPKLASDFLAMGPDQIRAVDWNVRRIAAWYEDHWPMFVPVEDLRRAREAIRQEINKANPLVVQLDDEDEPTAKPAGDEDPATAWLDPKKPLPREQVQQRFERYVDGFYVHPDHRSLTIVVRPTGTSLGVKEARALINRMHKLVDRHAQEIQANHLRVGFAGSFPLFVAEYEAIINDVKDTALLCVSLVLLSILLFFRDVRSTLCLGVAVLTAVAVTFGLTRLTIGYLNTQTAFLGAIVLGNGINYGLIYLARVHQLRQGGVALLPACVEGATSTAEATLLASAATSVSFATLIIAANRGFRHFGIIGGMGMLLCWLGTFLLVPALLAIYERLRGAPRQKPGVAEEGRALMPTLRRFFARPTIVAAVFGFATVVALVAFLRDLPDAMERNLENLSNEIKGNATLLRDHDRAGTSLGTSTASVLALLDSWPEADEFCDVIRRRALQPRYAKLIDSCNTMSMVVPRPQQQTERLAAIHDLVSELSGRILAHVPADRRGRIEQVRAQLAAQKPVTVEQAPPNLVDKFREKDGSVGKLAQVVARSDAKLELGPNLEAFVKAVRDVPVNGRRVDATGENVIFADLLTDIDTEGPRTTLLSFTGVFLLVIFFFRHVRTSVEVLGSLTVGVALMSGVAALLHLKINFFNFIVYPITFGIAVDYGANVAARVRERGGRVLDALAEVGPAVALCSWTSIIGYGSLLISLNRALRSFGQYAMIGEVTTILTALVLLPALLIIAHRQSATRARDLAA
jgi:predicted RND superfamily exporter protein